MLTPFGWESDYSVYRGATFNLGHQLSQMMVFRPHNKFEELDKCWLVGGGTHPGSSLPTILESARITANGILKEDGKSGIPIGPLPKVEDMHENSHNWRRGRRLDGRVVFNEARL